MVPIDVTNGNSPEDSWKIRFLLQGQTLDDFGVSEMWPNSHETNKAVMVMAIKYKVHV